MGIGLGFCCCGEVCTGITDASAADIFDFTIANSANWAIGTACEAWNGTYTDIPFFSSSGGATPTFVFKKTFAGIGPSGQDFTMTISIDNFSGLINITGASSPPTVQGFAMQCRNVPGEGWVGVSGAICTDNLAIHPTISSFVRH